MLYRKFQFFLSYCIFVHLPYFQTVTVCSYCIQLLYVVTVCVTVQQGGRSLLGLVFEEICHFLKCHVYQKYQVKRKLLTYYLRINYCRLYVYVIIIIIIIIIYSNNNNNISKRRIFRASKIVMQDTKLSSNKKSLFIQFLAAIRVLIIYKHSIFVFPVRIYYYYSTITLLLFLLSLLLLLFFSFHLPSLPQDISPESSTNLTNLLMKNPMQQDATLRRNYPQDSRLHSRSRGQEYAGK